MSFSAFEHKLLDHLKSQGVEAEYTVACSGGLDSVVLLTALNKIKPVLKFKLRALHIHHGSSLDADKLEQSKYRETALLFVKSLAKKTGLEFVFEKSERFLESEEACRDFRVETFKQHDCVLTAHHKNDFLETVLMRMLRGAGPQGLESPFRESSQKPFLNLFTRAELETYARGDALEWVQDPSNQSADPLRNWLRNKWLKDLDEKLGREGLEKSLLLISQAMKTQKDCDFNNLITFQSEEQGSFDFETWLHQDRFQKQSMIAHVLLKVRKKGYTHGQIEETVKQLDQSRKLATFRSGKLLWEKSESKVSFKLDL